METKVKNLLKEIEDLKVVINSKPVLDVRKEIKEFGEKVDELEILLNK